MGEGHIDTRIKAATDEELEQFGNLFSDRTTRGLTDGHLWFSVFSRPARSHFTRLQRLSCCLTLLMTTMLSSIMFYGVPTNPEDQVLDFGSFRVTVREIIIGIESSIIAFPINLLIVQIFRMAQPPAEIQHKKRKQRKRTLMSPDPSSTSWEENCDDTDKVSTKQQRNSVSRAAETMKGDNIKLISTEEDTSSTGSEFKRAKIESVNFENSLEHFVTPRGSQRNATNICKYPEEEQDPAVSNQVSPASTAKGVSTCESALSYFGGESSAGTTATTSRKSSASSLARQADISSSGGSLYEDADFVFPRDHELTPKIVYETSSSGSDELPLLDRNHPNKDVPRASSSGFSSGTWSDECSVTKLNDTFRRHKPIGHNELLYHKLEEIVIDLEHMPPSKFATEKEYHRAKEEAKALLLTAKSIRTPSLTSSSSDLSSSDHSQKDAGKSTGSRRCSGRLPHWFIYVGWFILAMTTLVSSYVIMLYGLKYGKQRSLAWLTSLFVSTFQSIFITQPLKVLLLATFVAMILKKWEEDDTTDDDVEDIDIGELVSKQMLYKPKPLLTLTRLILPLKIRGCDARLPDQSRSETCWRARRDCSFPQSFSAREFQR